MVHILAVDDDPDVLGTLERVLKREGYTVTTALSGQKALDILEKLSPDLLILDIIMPEMDGVTVCRTLRTQSRFSALPILFLTAKGSTNDIVEGLDAGADDYVVKPFELVELQARVQALLRRGMRQQNTTAPTLTIGNLQIDSNTYEVKINESTIQLTSTEHRLLRYMMENFDQALSLSHLLNAVWEYPEGTGDPDLVRAHIRNLRTKIEIDSARKYIRTVHGIGYMISS